MITRQIVYLGSIPSFSSDPSLSIANQQTIVELLGFFRRISPPQKTRREDSLKAKHRKQDSSGSEEGLSSGNGTDGEDDMIQRYNTVRVLDVNSLGRDKSNACSIPNCKLKIYTM